MINNLITLTDKHGKMLHQKYNVQIVRVTDGITFDYNTPGSFFCGGLQLLLAEEDNINRSIKVRVVFKESL